MIYNKLVRDRIPEIILSQGKKPKTRTATKKEFRRRLLNKLREEIAEFATKGNIEEFADIKEVLEAIRKERGFKRQAVSLIRRKKAKKRGTFRKRIILEKVS